MPPAFDRHSFLQQLPHEGRLLGIDHGTKRIGLAMSDVTRRFINPLETLSHVKFAVNARQIAHIVAQENVCGLVVGYPLNMDGTEGPRCQSVRQFVRNLEAYVVLPTLFWDERLSSDTAHSQMLEAALPAAQRSAKVDKLAAAAILTSFIEAEG